VYVPPTDSKAWKLSQDGFGIKIHVLEKCIVDLFDSSDDFHVLVCGDLNARTASRNFVNTALEQDELTYIHDDTTLYQRSSQDKDINVFGEQLLEFCNIFDCIILNGLRENNFDGSFTYIAKTGASVVDYFLMSCELYDVLSVESMNVLDSVESDHVPIQLKVEIHEILKEDKTFDNSYSLERIVWDKHKESKFFRFMFEIGQSMYDQEKERE